LGLRTVQWSVAGFDWKKRTGAEIAARVLRDVKAGSVILLHDGDSARKRDRSATVMALPIIIEGLQARRLNVVPLSELLEPERNVHKSTPGKKAIVFLEFDATITRRDGVDAIHENFADPRWLAIEEDWNSGRIGSRECLAAQMQLVRATKDQIDALLDSIELDPGFIRVLESCQRYGVQVHIVSDGFDYCIDRILNRPSLNLSDRLKGVRILSSHIEPHGNHWTIGFPSFHQSCAHGCATCKPAMMSLLNRGGATIFVGDGLSDKYAALIADLVFAKDRLAKYCQEQRIKHLEFENLEEVAAQLDELLSSNAVIEQEPVEEVGA